MAARTRRAPAPTGTGRCGTCRAPVIAQLGGVLDILVDAEPIPAGADATIRGPNRLTWCAPPVRHGPLRLRWVYPTHPPDCPHPHHADHQCTPRTPADPLEQAPPGALF